MTIAQHIQPMLPRVCFQPFWLSHCTWRPNTAHIQSPRNKEGSDSQNKMAFNKETQNLCSTNRQKKNMIGEPKGQKQWTAKGTKEVNLYIWGESSRKMRCRWRDWQVHTGEGNDVIEMTGRICEVRGEVEEHLVDRGRMNTKQHKDKVRTWPTAHQHPVAWRVYITTLLWYRLLARRWLLFTLNFLGNYKWLHKTRIPHCIIEKHMS